MSSDVVSPPLASLPWYDLPEVRPATDALWRALAAEFAARGAERVPERLERRVRFDRQWESGRLLFSQACGYDVRIAYPQCLQLVATPRYSADGCEGPNYSSFVVVRDDAPYQRLADLFDTRCVINTRTSHSGMNILRSLIAPLHVGGRFFREVRASGAHVKSLDRIRSGSADVAAIDCVTWALIARERPAALLGTRVLTRTPQVPAPPFVTAAGTPPEVVAALAESLAAVCRDPALAPIRAHLLLDGVERLQLDAYDCIAELERVAIAQGYHEIQNALE